MLKEEGNKYFTVRLLIHDLNNMKHYWRDVIKMKRNAVD